MLLAENPSIGRKRNEIKEGLFSLRYVSHVIFYRILEN
ncbi:type II toxin-antitoxin system RelE/ParE family toxin [Arenibacter palladensis]|nr:type II toxin-antitoxin system RelE/ParE family toxin [Arenibacter palladensis]MDO6601506.1 type II toxin-antitoxin system RelE/ParE family toxin [Arenibacter palladensis]